MYCNESIEWVIEVKPLRIHCQFWNILLAAIMKIIRVIQRWRMQMKNIWPVFIPNRFYCSLSLLEIGMEGYFSSFYEWILNTVRLTAELAETLLSCTYFEFSMIFWKLTVYPAPRQIGRRPRSWWSWICFSSLVRFAAACSSHVARGMLTVPTNLWFNSIWHSDNQCIWNFLFDYKIGMAGLESFQSLSFLEGLETTLFTILLLLSLERRVFWIDSATLRWSLILSSSFAERWGHTVKPTIRAHHIVIFLVYHQCKHTCYSSSKQIGHDLAHFRHGLLDIHGLPDFLKLFLGFWVWDEFWKDWHK